MTNVSTLWGAVSIILSSALTLAVAYPEPNAPERACVKPAGCRFESDAGGSFYARAVVMPAQDDDERAGWHEKQWVVWYASTLPAGDDARVEVAGIEGSRVDILTRSHAYEVDYAHKWAEGVGQCLFYGAMTNRPPALLLLCHRGDDNDRRAYLRALVVCNAHKIKLIAVQIPPAKPA